MSRKKRPEGTSPSKLASPTPSGQLATVRAELRAAIAKLKALGCEDSMVLVEFWHALDCVNGVEAADL